MNMVGDVQCTHIVRDIPQGTEDILRVENTPVVLNTHYIE